MIFEHNFERNEVLYTHHKIAKREIDLAHKRIDVEIHSWVANETTPTPLKSFVVIDFEEWSESLLNNLEAQVVAKEWLTAKPEIVSTKTIEELRSEKIAFLNKMAQLEIYAGFQSGSCRYPAKEKDQINLTMLTTDSYNPEITESWRAFLWCQNASDEWVFLEHTVPELRAVYSDYRALVQAVLTKKANLQALVNLANTQSTIEAITW